MNKNILGVTVLALALLSGCSPTTKLIDVQNDSTERVAGLEYRDFENAARTLVNEMLMSGSLNKPDKGKYVLIVSRIANNTMQYIDVDQLSKKIRIDLINSGKVVVTNLLEDDIVLDSRELRKSDEINQKTVAKKGSLIAPELSLSGKITQREFWVSNKKRIEYTFAISITNIETGLTVYEGETTIIKSTAKNAITW